MCMWHQRRDSDSSWYVCNTIVSLFVLKASIHGINRVECENQKQQRHGCDFPLCVTMFIHVTTCRPSLPLRLWLRFSFHRMFMTWALWMSFTLDRCSEQVCRLSLKDKKKSEALKTWSNICILLSTFSFNMKVSCVIRARTAMSVYIDYMIDFRVLKMNRSLISPLPKISLFDLLSS